MKDSLTERRMAQNQVSFKKINKRVQNGFDRLKKISEEDGVEELYVDPRMLLFFLCECSDENCNKRVEVMLGEYNTIHRSSKQFILYHKHNIPGIEEIVLRGHDYIVVRKFKEPPKENEVKGPLETGVDNSSK